MYYVLFHYKKKRGKAWIPCSIEAKVIEFLHESYEDIFVHEIIEVKAKHRLGLVVTEDYIKSELEPKEEAESLVPIDKDLDPVVLSNAILREKKRKLKELEAEEPSAMEKIIDDTEKEQEEDNLTDEEKVEKQIDEADQLIEREKKREKQRKKGWKLCTVCNSNRVTPWNKKKICSTCQTKRSTTRPYKRREEAPGL
jgi:hypothetical protein